jgi:uncharacterized protein YcbK (DUF882 family)
LRALIAAYWGKKALARALLAPLFAVLGLAPNSTESASANGETRTINLIEPHTNETGSFTYMVNGVYDSNVLEKLNWFMRDWRHDEQTKMDPKLFDVVWEVYRESGSTQPVEVLSGYRSPETNAMLRRRSRQVAEHSQHILGKAMDAHFLDVPTSRIRDIAMRMQDGGVGFYPTGISPWVHLDTGSVRYWPRMSRDALVRLFPDGKTVHIPADGVPLAGYEQARAEIEARGGSVFAATSYAGGPSSLLAMLFGGGEDEGEDEQQATSDAPRGRGSTSQAVMIAKLAATSASGQQSSGQQIASAKPDPVSLAKRNLPQGETYLQPGPPAAPAEPPPQKTQVAAAVEQPKSDESAVEAAPSAPTPPHRPSEFLSLNFGFGAAPTPPVRPTEFAALQSPTPGAAAGSQQKNDSVAELLTRKLPGIITRGVGGALPANALALADPGAAVPPERPALLAKAAALSAPPLPPVAPARLSPLARAAQLTAVLPPIGPTKPTLVAARLDQSHFGVMTASKALAAEPVARALAGLSPRADAMVAALEPVAQSDGMLRNSPYGNLRVETFGASTPRASSEAASVLDADLLRGTD